MEENQMKKQSKKFLEFNGKVMYFLAKDGVYWIGIKPICEALNVDYIAQFKRLKTDKILSQLLSEQTMVAADNKVRKMSCLPEKFVYGWIFTIQSSSPDLLSYQWECYQVLFDYFQGAITQREKTLKDKVRMQFELNLLEAKLGLNDDFKRYLALKAGVTKSAKELKFLDQDLVSGQMELWEQEFETEKAN